MLNKELYITEFFASFFVGAIPCFLITLAGGLDATAGFLEAIDISDFNINYALALFAISVVVALMSRFIPRYNDGAKYRMLLYLGTFEKSGSTLASIFRVLTGVLFALIFICFYNLSEAGWRLTGVCVFLTLFFLFAASFFEYISSIAHEKAK